MAGASRTVKKRKAKNSRFFESGLFDFAAPDRLVVADLKDFFDDLRAMHIPLNFDLQ
jgi:hypothetical protein